jgi:hypothetical protein
MANIGAPTGPVSVYDQVHGWQATAGGALDASSFVGCNVSAYTFSLH